ncbi:MAG: Mov34/MPN/PAD-1 family protein [Rhodospirillales bacterium]
MIRIPARLLADIAAAAERAYPEECCGLLVGTGAPGSTVVVGRVVASANVAPAPRRDRFEIDPKLRFDLMRALADGAERVVGHYHSHPDQPARPSQRDLDMAWEPDLVWLITAVVDGRATETTAHRVDPAGGRFRAIALAITD